MIVMLIGAQKPRDPDQNAKVGKGEGGRGSQMHSKLQSEKLLPRATLR